MQYFFDNFSEETHVYVDDPGQWVLGVGAAFNGDAQNRFGLFHGDAQVALMIGHHQGAVFFSSLGHLAAGQSLHAVMPPRWAPRCSASGGPAAGTTLLEQLCLLHVEASRELMRELLQRTQLVFERRMNRDPVIRPDSRQQPEINLYICSLSNFKVHVRSLEL